MEDLQAGNFCSQNPMYAEIRNLRKSGTELYRYSRPSKWSSVDSQFLLFRPLFFLGLRVLYFKGFVDEVFTPSTA